MSASAARRTLEVLTGSIVVRRRLPRELGGGVIVASSRAGGLRYLFRRPAHLDPTLFAVARALVGKGDVIWDVGANVGLFAAVSAGLAGNKGAVYSFEPDEEVYRLLKRTAKAASGRHARIHPICMAVADSPSLARLNIAKRSRSANFLEGFGTTQTGGVAATRVVPALSLDLLLQTLPAPSVLKVDVEGAELRVLEGGRTLLQFARPRIFIEVAGENAMTMETLLRSCNYHIYDGETLAAIEGGHGAPYNTVAIPIEKKRPAALRDH